MDDGSLSRRSRINKNGDRVYAGFYITISTYCKLEQAEDIIKYFNILIKKKTASAALNFVQWGDSRFCV